MASSRSSALKQSAGALHHILRLPLARQDGAPFRLRFNRFSFQHRASDLAGIAEVVQESLGARFEQLLSSYNQVAAAGGEMRAAGAPGGAAKRFTKPIKPHLTILEISNREDYERFQASCLAAINAFLAAMAAAAAGWPAAAT